jgi:hypothetical protein
VNRAQGIVLAVLAGNVVVMLLFPPYDSLVLGRGGAETFDAFYFALQQHFNKVIDANLLLLELYWAVINGALAWLLLRPRAVDVEPLMRARPGVVLLTVANICLVLLFPPFENYASTLRNAGTYFDGFYFVFGDKWDRRFYVPLLYIEVFWILVNGALLWLLLRDEPAPTDRDRD